MVPHPLSELSPMSWVCQSCSHCSGYPLFAFKSGISGRRSGGAWGCCVDGEVPSGCPTTTEMPMASSGRAFLPGAGIRTIFSTPAWLLGWRKRGKTAKTGKRFLLTSRMEASFLNFSERLYQTMPWFNINLSPPLVFQLKCIFVIISPLGRLVVPDNSISWVYFGGSWLGYCPNTSFSLFVMV